MAGQCMRCRAVESSYYQLSCQHIYCLLCCAYRHIKLLSLGRPGSLLECEFCEKVTELDQETIDLLTAKVQEQIIPRIQARLHEDKDDPFTTPRAERTWLTNSMVKLKKSCTKHTRETQEFNCITCRTPGLCWKCVSGGQHRHHQLQAITSLDRNFREQLQLSQLELKQRSEELTIGIQRMNLLSGILAQRHERIAADLSRHFEELLARAAQTKSQLVKDLGEAVLQMQSGLRLTIDTYQLDIEKLRALIARADSLQEGQFQILTDIKGQLASFQRPAFKEQPFLERSQTLFDPQSLIPLYEHLSRMRLNYQEEDDQEQDRERPESRKQMSAQTSQPKRLATCQTDQKSEKARNSKLLGILESQKKLFRMRSSYRFNFDNLTKQELQRIILQHHARSKAAHRMQHQDDEKQQQLLEDGVVIEQQGTFMRRLVTLLFVVITLLIVFQYKGEQFMKLAKYQSTTDHYHTLNVDPSATPTQIKASYKALLKKLHPDRCPSPACKDQFQEVHKAYQVLSSPSSRAEYDLHTGSVPGLPTKALILDQAGYEGLQYSGKLWMVAVIDQSEEASRWAMHVFQELVDKYAGVVGFARISLLRHSHANSFLPYKFSLLPGFFIQFQTETSLCDLSFQRPTLKKNLEDCLQSLTNPSPCKHTLTLHTNLRPPLSIQLLRLTHCLNIVTKKPGKDSKFNVEIEKDGVVGRGMAAMRNLQEFGVVGRAVVGWVGKDGVGREEYWETCGVGQFHKNLCVFVANDTEFRLPLQALLNPKYEQTTLIHTTKPLPSPLLATSGHFFQPLQADDLSLLLAGQFSLTESLNNESDLPGEAMMDMLMLEPMADQMWDSFRRGRRWIEARMWMWLLFGVGKVVLGVWWGWAVGVAVAVQLVFALI